MAVYEIVHVAVAPPDVLEPDLIKKVAAIADKDPYETRLLLARKTPGIIAHYRSIQTAESVARSLRDLGLVAIVCKDSELRKTTQGFRACAVEFGEKEVLFRDSGNGVRRIGPGDVFLILKGRVETHTKREAIRTRMKFNLPATVLTGGIPIWSRVKEKTEDSSVRTESFVRLYGLTSPEPEVEIFQHDFNYSFLGMKTASSSLTNLNTLITELRNEFPQAVFDGRLTELFVEGIPLATLEGGLEINCKLIYLCHRCLHLTM